MRYQQEPEGRAAHLRDPTLSRPSPRKPCESGSRLPPADYLPGACILSHFSALIGTPFPYSEKARLKCKRQEHCMTTLLTSSRLTTSQRMVSYYKASFWSG